MIFFLLIQFNFLLGEPYISNWMRELCQRAGIPERTNHILRDVAPTRMADAGVPINIIQNQTNHRSVSSLKLYINVHV